MSSNPNQNTNPHIDDRDAQPQPGLIAGHAEYIKGAAEVCFSLSFPSSVSPFPLLIYTPPSFLLSMVY